MIPFGQEERQSADLGRVLEALLDRPSHVRDITRAVEACLGEEPGVPVLASDRALLLSARALSSVGDRMGADVVMRATTGLADWAGRVDPAGLPADTTRLIEAGLLSATASPVLGSGLTVRLDMALLPVQETLLELIYLPLIHRLVDACVPLWREMAGEGVLLVKGLARHQGSRRAAWMSEAFRHRLEWKTEREGWPHPPRLVYAG